MDTHIMGESVYEGIRATVTPGDPIQRLGGVLLVALVLFGFAILCIILGCIAARLRRMEARDERLEATLDTVKKALERCDTRSRN
jgi:hypothetical protein